MPVSDYLANHGEQLEVLLFDFNSYERPLFILQFPALMSWSDVKATITREAGVSYDPSCDAMEFYKESHLIPNEPALQPLTLTYHQPSLLWSRGYLFDAVVHKVFFNVIRGVTEAELQQTLLLTLHIARDGYVVDEVAKLRVTKGITVAQLVQTLADRGLIPAEQDFRVSEEWVSKLYKKYEPGDWVVDRSSAFRVDLVTDEQKQLGADDVLICGVHAYCNEWETYSRFAFPFYLPVFAAETGREVKEKVKRFLRLADDVFAGLVLTIGNLYSLQPKDVRPIEDDDVIVEFLKKCESPLLYIIHPDKAKEKRHVGAVKYRFKEIPIRIKN
jgi:hypothetical protein